MAAPKPSRLENLPETCGSCRHAHDVSGQAFLICYGSPPSAIVTADGEVEWHRGAPVESGDNCCHLFSPRNRA